jgi:hypothetical protein
MQSQKLINGIVTFQDNHLDIHKYTISELSNMIGVNDNFSESNIKIKCNKLISSFRKSQTKQSKDYIEFINKVQSHLINYIQHKSIGYNSEIENMYQKTTSKNFQLEMKETDLNAPISSFNTLFPKSIINPVYKETFTQLVSIDSLFRERTQMSNGIDYYQTSSHFLYNFANPLKNIVSMSISSIELPVVWYLINEGNNTFTIETKNNPDGFTPDIVHTITIPIGSYTTTSIVNTINNIFTNIGNGLQYIIFGIDDNNAKSYFRAKKSNYDDGDIGFNDPYLANPDPVNPFFFNIYFYKDFSKMCEKKTLKEYDSFGWLLGFRGVSYSVTKSNEVYDYYTFNTAYTLYNYLLSEGAYGTSAYNYIYVDVDDFNNNFKSSGIIADNNNNILSNTILGRINIPNPANTVLFNNSSDRIFKTREYFGPMTINRLEFRLLDKFGNLINLQNNDWSVALEFTVLYK